jgi:hypothetical protein
MKIQWVALLCLSLVIGFQAHAQGTEPYVLMPIENADYRDFTLNELTTSIGADARYLTQYQCDGDYEYQVFTDSIQSNSARDSFRVSDGAGRVFIYREGKLYTAFNTEASEISDAFVIKAVSALNELEKIDASRTLLRELESGRYSVTLAKGGNRFDPKLEGGRSYFGIYQAQAIPYFVTLRKADDAVPFHQIGNGGVVHWDPETKYDALESDGIVRGTPVVVALAHELYHAYDSSRGLLDQRGVNGAGYEFQPVTEWRAVYFENQVRRASGIHYRKRYSIDKLGDTPNDSMLDSHQQPILIQSSCLR